LSLATIDYLILAIYFAFVLGIGFFLRRQVKSSEDFLISGKSMPMWVTSLAFLAANLGAQEVIGMCASGAKYGMLTAHFYWLGAIPAMLFVGIFMMPFYYGSRARSVPEYLKLRFDEKTRTFNALTFAAMTLFSSGLSMYTLGLLFQLILGWSFDNSILLSAGIVLVYTLMGGLASAIYNEVLQFFLIVFGFAPLAWYSIMQAGGWGGIVARVDPALTHLWANLDSPANNQIGVEWFGMAAGLGFVLAFGYWCTDFLVVQRAMAARSMSAARCTPVIATLPKMLMPFIVVLPGIAAMGLVAGGMKDLVPMKGEGYDYDQVMTALMAQYYPSGMLGVGITALIASFMSGMAGNVTAFNTVWTYDLYQTHLNPGRKDEHYLTVGRWTTVVGIILSIATAYLARQFNNVMDFLQLVFGFVNAPLFATFLLGMFWKRATGHGAFWGLVSGTLSASLVHGLTVAERKGGWLGSTLFEFRSTMAQNFWIAIAAWSACFLVTIAISLLTKAHQESDLRGLVYSLTEIRDEPGARWYEKPVPLSIGAAVLCLALNIYFW
jgi:solute:Na+ symporter, SSS family